MWNEQAKGLEPAAVAGGTPILTAGLKVQPWSTAGKDAQLAEMAKLTEENIALAFRVPLHILGIGGTALRLDRAAHPAMAGEWLGFALNHHRGSLWAAVPAQGSAGRISGV